MVHDFLLGDTNILIEGENIYRKSVLYTINDDEYNEWGKEGIQSMSSYLDSIVILGETHNFNIKIAIYPWPDQIMFANKFSYDVYWEKWCKEREIELINYFPDFIIPNQSKKSVLK